MSIQFESYIKELKEAIINRERSTATTNLEEATAVLADFSEEEVEENTVLIGHFHRLSMSFMQNLAENHSADELHSSLEYHLKALEGMGLAEVDDYLRLSADTERFNLPLLERVLLAHPEHPQLIRDLGKYYLHNQEYEAAFTCLKRAADSCPEDLSVTASLYECCHQYAEHLQEEEEVGADQVEKILMLYTEMHDGYACLNILNGKAGKQLSDSVRENYLAISYFRTGNYQQALDLWNKMYKEDTLSTKSIIAYAEFEILNNNKVIGVDLLEGMLDYNKTELPQAETVEDLLVFLRNESNNLCNVLHSYALLGSAQDHFGAGDKAEELLKEGLRLKPNDTDLLLKLGKVYVKQEKVEQAVVQLNLARKAGLSESKYLLEMAEIYFRIAEWGKAFELINQYHSLDVATPLSTYLGGVAARHLGNKSDAYHLLTSCITGFNQHSYIEDAFYHRALLSRSVFRFQEALGDVEGALTYVEEWGELHRKFQLLRGDLLFNLQQYEQSFTCLSQAHQQTPLAGQPLLYLQILIHSDYIKEEDIPENVPTLSDESIIKNPKDALEHVYNAKVYISLKQYLKSAESFVAAADAGYLPEMHYKKAFKMAHKVEALPYLIDIYRMMAAKFIIDFTTTAHYAFALYQSKRYEETITAYEEMAYRYPEMMETSESRNIWSHTIAHSYQLLGQYDDAIQYYSILLSGMKLYDRGFVKRLQEIAEHRPDKDDFSRYSLLQYMKFANIALDEAEEESLKNLERQMEEIRYVL